MKNVFKVLGIITLVALIGFSMIACGDEGGGPAGGGGGGGGGNSGAWPPNSVLSQFGLSGMPAPTGATNIQWASITNEILHIEFAGTPATDAAALRWLENNGWTLATESYDYKGYQKPPLWAFYYWDQVDSNGRSRDLSVTYQ